MFSHTEFVCNVMLNLFQHDDTFWSSPTRQTVIVRLARTIFIYTTLYISKLTVYFLQQPNHSSYLDAQRCVRPLAAGVQSESVKKIAKAIFSLSAKNSSLSIYLHNSLYFKANRLLFTAAKPQ